MYARGWLRVNKVSYAFEVIKNWKPLAHMWLRETLKLARRIGWKSSRIQTRPPFGQLAQHFQLNAQKTLILARSESFFLVYFGNTSDKNKMRKWDLSSFP